MSPPSTAPELILRPALCLRGIPLGVGMPDFSSVSLRAVGVAKLLPSLLLPVSDSRSDIDNDWEWLCPDMPLNELRGRCMRPLIDALP
jgi:hypothetical protein